MADWNEFKPNLPAPRKTDDSKAASPSKTQEDARRTLQAQLGVTAPTSAVVLAVDCSSSMDVGDKLDQAKQGAIEFADSAFKKGYQVGLVRFATQAAVIAAPTSSPAGIREGVDGLVAAGATMMAKALELSRDLLRGCTGRRTIVLVTDGQAGDGVETLKMAEALKSAGVDLITIGTDDADVGFLKTLASRQDLATFVGQAELRKGIATAASLLSLPAPKT